MSVSWFWQHGFIASHQISKELDRSRYGKMVMREPKEESPESHDGEENGFMEADAALLVENLLDRVCIQEIAERELLGIPSTLIWSRTRWRVS